MSRKRMYELPSDEAAIPSVLVEEVLVLLEDAGVPTEVNDKITGLIEDWEKREADCCCKSYHERTGKHAESCPRHHNYDKEIPDD